MIPPNKNCLARPNRGQRGGDGIYTVWAIDTTSGRYSTDSLSSRHMSLVSPYIFREGGSITPGPISNVT